MILFAEPVWLALLPLLIGVWWYFIRKRVGHDLGNARLVLVHPDLSHLPIQAQGNSPGPRLELAMVVLAQILLVLALAQPQRTGELIPEKPEGREIVLLIDTSRTMSIDDFEQDGKRVDRLSVLKEVVSRFVRAREGDRFGVVVYGSTAAMMVPPTFDRDLVTGMVSQVEVGMAGNDTAMGDAIGLALKHLRERQAMRPALILFSDNTDNNAGVMTPAEAVELAKRMGVAIYTVQIGSDLFAEGRVAPPAKIAREPSMAEIAGLTSGHFYRADSSNALQAVIEEIGKREKTVIPDASRHVIEEWYALLVLISAALLTAARIMNIRRAGI